jgi:hypothetical protein
MKKKKRLRVVISVLLPIAVLSLAGCWTTPNANVQSKGQPGLIQDRIAVESVGDSATVQAVDAGQGTITLSLPSGRTATYKVGPKVKHFDEVQVSDKVKATMTEKLAVYALENDRLPDGTTAETLGVNAKVLLVDPSYRLLTLQYANGQFATFKPDLHTRIQQMSPGNSVVVRPGELTAIRIEKP